MCNAINTVHLKNDRREEKAMEAESKNKFCNINRDFIKIYFVRISHFKEKNQEGKVLVVKTKVMSGLNSRCQIYF